MNAVERTSKDVEHQDTGKDLFAGFRDVSSRVLRLSSCHCQAFHTRKAEDGVCHHRPIAQELTPWTGCDVLNERSWLLPIPEPDALLSWDASKVDDQTEDDQEDDQENLQTREEEVHFAVDTDKRDADYKREDDEYTDPDRGVQISPILE